MRRQGTSAGSHRAWIGVNCVEDEGAVKIIRISDDSPADVAGLKPGDRILRIDGKFGEMCLRRVETKWLLSWFNAADYDIIVLDLMLPGLDGLEVLHQIKTRLGRFGKSLRQRNDSQLLPVHIDHSNRSSPDLTVDP